MNKPISEHELPTETERPSANTELQGGDELQEYAEAARRQAWQDPLQSAR
jgi:hypothetical protein